MSINPRRHCLQVAVIALLIVSSQAWSADGVLESAARTLKSASIHTLEFEASGTYYQFSQAPGPGLPWPAFEVRDYVATVDFDTGAVHSRYARLQKPEAGRVRPAPVGQKMDQYMMNGLTWNVGADGTPAAIPTNVAERTAEIWTTPQGFVRAAQRHKAVIDKTPGGGASVTFSLDDFRYEGTLSKAGEVLRVKTWMDSPVLGDTAIEWRFSNYRDFDGVYFPARIERSAGGFPWYELDVTRVRVNSAQPFSVPAEVARNPVPSVSQVNVTPLSAGVFYLTGSSHNSVVIEQAHGVVVVEAPLNEERSLAVIARIRELIPAKRITHVINTHVHFDHAGGLRTYADEGATIVTATSNVPYLEEAWKAPRTLNADRLSKSKRPARFQGFTGKIILADDEHPIEVHEIVGSGHSDAFAMIYLPTQKVLIEGDAWTPAPIATNTAANPFWVNLYDNIQRLQLNVERIAPLHGSMQTMGDLRTAIGR